MNSNTTRTSGFHRAQLQRSSELVPQGLEYQAISWTGSWTVLPTAESGLNQEAVDGIAAKIGVPVQLAEKVAVCCWCICLFATLIVPASRWEVYETVERASAK